MRKAAKIAAMAAVSLAAATSRGAVVGNRLYVVQVGDGTAGAYDGTYKTGAVTIRSYDLTTGAAASSTALSGVSLTTRDDDADGHLNLSGNGQYLLLGADAVAAGAPYPNTGTSAATSSTTAPRAVVRVDGSGSQLTVPLAGTYAAQTINAVVSVDGQSFWTVGANDAALSGGLRYVPTTSSTTTVNVSGTQAGTKGDAYRGARLIGGQLFVNTTSTGPTFPNRGSYVMSIGGGLPVASANTPATATPVITNHEGSTTDFFGNADGDGKGKLHPKTDAVYLDLNNDGNYDLAYSTGGKDDLEKWARVGSNWVREDVVYLTSGAGNNEINALDYTYDAATGAVTLFLANDFGIFRLADAGAYDAGIASPLVSALDSDNPAVRYISSGSLFVGVDANMEFRGLAAVPAAVPEPAGLALAIAAGAVALARRRR